MPALATFDADALQRSRGAYSPSAGLEHLPGSDLGFRNLTNYIARSLLETGGFSTPATPSFGMILIRLLGEAGRPRPHETRAQPGHQ